jgi:hypothetical protein
VALLNYQCFTRTARRNRPPCGALPSGAMPGTAKAKAGSSPAGGAAGTGKTCVTCPAWLVVVGTLSALVWLPRS